jgi:hypothetical protein
MTTWHRAAARCAVCRSHVRCLVIRAGSRQAGVAAAVPSTCSYQQIMKHGERHGEQHTLSHTPPATPCYSDSQVMSLALSEWSDCTISSDTYPLMAWLGIPSAAPLEYNGGAHPNQQLVPSADSRIARSLARLSGTCAFDLKGCGPRFAARPNLCCAMAG